MLQNKMLFMVIDKKADFLDEFLVSEFKLNVCHSEADAGEMHPGR